MCLPFFALTASLFIIMARNVRFKPRLCEERRYKRNPSSYWRVPTPVSSDDDDSSTIEATKPPRYYRRSIAVSRQATPNNNNSTPPSGRSSISSRQSFTSCETSRRTSSISSVESSVISPMEQRGFLPTNETPVAVPSTMPKKEMTSETKIPLPQKVYYVGKTETDTQIIIQQKGGSVHYKKTDDWVSHFKSLPQIGRCNNYPSYTKTRLRNPQPQPRLTQPIPRTQ